MNKVSNKIYVEPDYAFLKEIAECLNQIIQEGLHARK